MNNEIRVGDGIMAQIQREENIYGQLTLGRLKEALDALLESSASNEQNLQSDHFYPATFSNPPLGYDYLGDKIKTTKEKIKNIKI